VIVDAYGQARIKQVGEAPVAVEPLMRIYEGTALEVKSGGLVEFYRMLDGRRYEVLGPCVVRVNPEGPVVLQGRQDCIRWIESAGQGDLIDPSHAPGRGFQNQKLRLRFGSDGPTFAWDTELPGPYWIRVFTAHNGQMDKVLWTAQTNDTRVRYGGPPLEADRSYVWQVAADKTLSSARFRMVSDGALDSFQRTETELTRWKEAHPDDPGVLVVMALLYDQNDQPDKALAALQEAKRRQSPDVQQKVLDLRMSQLLQETNEKADSQYNPFGYSVVGPGYMAPGYIGNWNWGYPGWGRFSPWLW
jgi:hypothetical protein